VYHRIGAGLGSMLGMDPLSALRLLALVGLVLLLVTAALLGRRLYGTTGAGIMIGTLALVGLNPLGPGIAAARHFSKGAPLFEQEVGGRAVETTFVSNELADQLMSRKLLPSMYFSTDWRQGQNVVWFFDISSRGLALGVLMTLLLVLQRPVHRFPTWPAPTARRTSRRAQSDRRNRRCGRLRVLLPGIGLEPTRKRRPAGFASPARGRRTGDRRPARGAHVFQLFGQGGSATSINPPGMIVLKLINMGLNFGVIAVLVLLALRSSVGELGVGIRAAAITGALLLFAVALVHLEEGNEHNLTNAALVVLAVPAVAALVLDRTGQPRPQAAATRRLWLTGLVFLPGHLLHLAGLRWPAASPLHDGEGFPGPGTRFGPARGALPMDRTAYRTERRVCG
jgi:hypothetical protein